MSVVIEHPDCVYPCINGKRSNETRTIKKPNTSELGIMN